jgi:hypothetical protein
MNILPATMTHRRRTITVLFSTKGNGEKKCRRRTEKKSRTNALPKIYLETRSNDLRSNDEAVRMPAESTNPKRLGR